MLELIKTLKTKVILKSKIFSETYSKNLIDKQNKKSNKNYKLKYKS